MRPLLTLLFALAATAARAQSSYPPPDPSAEQAYIAARERADAELKAISNDQAKTAADDRLLGKLQPLLQATIGPIPMPKGFDREVMTVPDTLCCGVGLQMLDGQMFFSATGPGQVLVTTEGIFRHWLAAHAPGKGAKEALQSGGLVATAIAANWTIGLFGALPIATPPGASLAVADLAYGNQGFAYGPPPQIVVSVFKGGRVYIAFVDRKAMDPPIEICGALFAGYEAKAKAKPEDIKESNRLQEEGQAAFEKCWTERATNHAFPAVTKEAQTLADSLAGG